jgi:hypothetical protein
LGTDKHIVVGVECGDHRLYYTVEQEIISKSVTN